MARPYGFRLGAVDSLHVVATIPTEEDSGDLLLRVTIDYDPVDRPLMRLPVVPAVVRSPRSQETLQRDSDSLRTIVWEWTSDVTGALSVVAGASLADARELRVEHAQSGAVLWRRTFTDAVSGVAYERAGSTVLAGTPVVSGTEYRITVVQRAAPRAPSQSAAGTLLAMVMPVPGANP